MNTNALTQKTFVAVPQISSSIEWLLNRSEWQSQLLFPIVLLAYTLLFRQVVERSLGKQPYRLSVWIFALSAPLLFFWEYYRPSLLNQLLVLTFLTFDSLAVVVLSVLVYQQTNYAILIVICFHRYHNNFAGFLLFVVKVLALWLTLLGLRYYLIPLLQHSNGDSLKCIINEQVFPSVYAPNFSLIWLLHSHFFDRYRTLYSIFLFVLPLMAIYPLCRIIQRLNKPQWLVEPPLTAICLFVVYYFGNCTTAADAAFFLTMLIPARNHLARYVPASLPLIMAALLFYVLSLLVSKEWAANFTVPTSYLFYMLMPFWALAVVLVVEIVGSLVDQSDTYKEPENDKQCGASD